MSGDDSKFVGWVAHGPDSVEGKLKWEQYTPKKWTEDDIEMDIEACGICASDIHTLRSGWGPSEYPTVVGHEIVGKVTRVGSNVKNIKVGARVGVGAQSDSCHECKQCKENVEPYCDKLQGTYQGNFLNGSGKSSGGYAKHWRGPAHFTIPIPDGLDPAVAAPLCCGGITIYSPLADYGCGKPGVKRVGIVGIGGIGAFGLAFAKALGAEQVVAISSTAGKKDLAMQLGATDFVAMKDNPDDHKRFRRQLDLIITTANNHDQPYDKYIWMLRPRGHLVNVSVPEQPVMAIPLAPLIFSGANMGGSAIGGPKQIAEMLQLAADKKPNFMIEKRPMKDANQTVIDMVAGKPRFRYSLVNDM